VVCPQVGIVIKTIVIILDHWSKRVRLCWDNFDTFGVPIHVHIWNLRIRWRWRGVMCHIVIGCLDLLWILHFTLHNRISHWVRDALPMSALLIIATHLTVLAM